MQSIIQYRRIRRNIQQTAPPKHDAEKQENHAQTRRRDLAEYPSRHDESINTRHEDSETTIADPDDKTRFTSPKKQSRPSNASSHKTPFLVTFDSDSDHENPQNWDPSYKWTTTAIVGCTGFVVGWASSIDSAALKQAKADFSVSSVVEALAGTGIYLIAPGFGSLISGPFSETVGRNPVYLITISLFSIFIIASALSPNIGAQIIFRFLAGFFGCTPLTTFGGSVADMWSPLHRTFVFPICACLSFWGPFLAPMVGAFIGQSNAVSWRWTEWVTLIMSGLLLASILLFVPETYTPIILKWKAEHLRRVTGDDRYRAEIEMREEGLPTRLLYSVYRPFRMLVREPMVALFSIYLSVVYIVLFTFLTGYDFIFGDIYGFSQGNEGLTWIAVNIGFMIALAIVPLIYRPYQKKYLQAEREGDKVEPEQRLWYAMLGAPWFPISLFWMAWTSRTSISFWSPLMATVAFGFGTQGIFISCYMYLIDAYEGYVASALVGLTFTRYVVSGGMVVVSYPMYERLGVDWTLTLLGCIAAILTPVPYVFYRLGARIRAKSSTARSG